MPSRGQLVVCQRQPVFARAERLVRVGQQRAPGLPTGSAADRRLAGDSRSRRKVSYQPGSRRVSDRRHLRQHRPRLEGNARGRVCQTDAGRRGRAHEWATRKLPAPAARVAFAALEDHRTFAARWPVVASRLGIRAGAQLDVLADGARWIWERVDFHFVFAQGTLDIYHALEHVGRTAQALFGEGTTEAARWQAGARDALLGEGWPGIQRVIDPARVVAVGAPQRTAVHRLADYLRPHAQHLDYRKRLASGRPIGSGCIEGACKNYLGRRLKQTGARWLIPNANRMATLGSLVYADQWTDYWANSN